MVSSLRTYGVKAQSFNLIGGGDNLPTRDEVLAAVDEHGFDAVVVTRVLGSDMDVELRSGASGAKVKRKESGFMKLFRYDYEKLDDPPELTVNTEVGLVTELHSVEPESLVWDRDEAAEIRQHSRFDRRIGNGHRTQAGTLRQTRPLRFSGASQTRTFSELALDRQDTNNCRDESLSPRRLGFIGVNHFLVILVTSPAKLVILIEE